MCAANTCDVNRCVATWCDMVQISKHVRNMARHGESDRVEYLIQRWGKDTLMELCEVHEMLGLKPSPAVTCSHALFGEPRWYS